MRIHQNWSVTPQYLEELQGMTKKQVMKIIDDKNLFAGIVTEAAKKQKQALYERIKSGRTL